MNKNLFMKREICPICGKTTKQPHFKAKTYRLVNTDYDLYTHYKGVNPILYSAKICNYCGYANLVNVFEKPSKVLRTLRETSMVLNEPWKPWDIPEENDFEYAIKLHKLVLMNYMNDKDLLTGELGYICLKLYWLYKQCGNEKEMLRFRKLALTNLESCYSNQRFPIFDAIDNIKTMYIIAILSYYEGDIEKCKMWLSLVLQNKLTSNKIKAKAIDFKYEFLK